ncbi:MAG: 50S ribosomal protein L23 [Alphaproteobacteria bacterium]|nr:50S ribosomal protein L23 [Alphaproteobacteria bacterium]
MAEKKVKEVKTESSSAKATADKKKVAATAGTYDILRRPIISEKSAKMAEAGAMAFEIDARAGKREVAKAIKAIYNVSPEKVNIVNQKGKVKGKRFHGAAGKTKTVKKAYVTLKAGDKIEMASA